MAFLLLSPTPSVNSSHCTLISLIYRFTNLSVDFVSSLQQFHRPLSALFVTACWYHATLLPHSAFSPYFAPIDTSLAHSTLVLTTFCFFCYASHTSFTFDCRYLLHLRPTIRAPFYSRLPYPQPPLAVLFTFPIPTLPRCGSPPGPKSCLFSPISS